jgi:NAD(P)-dependent dehydrogenase (short-subunit alcohol dehydrogenase family)
VDGLDEVRRQLAQVAGASRIAIVRGDMTSETSAAVDEIECRLGRIDSAVANVGNGAAKSGYDLDRSEWLRALDTNLLGAGLLASCELSTGCPSGSDRGS